MNFLNIMNKYTHIAEPIFEQAKNHPNHPAFIFSGDVITYSCFENRSRRAASSLLAAGVKEGMRVAILSGNNPDIMAIYLGLSMIGAAIVPINPEYGKKEIKYIIDHSQSDYFIFSKSSRNLAEESRAISDCKPKLIELDNFFSSLGEKIFQEKMKGGGDKLALLCYTSGTTSKPKGVAATHSNELVSGLAYKDMWAMDSSDKVLVTLPLTFSFGFHAAAYVALISGSTILLSEKFHPRTALEAIELQKPTIFLGVPTMYAMMADVASKESKQFDTSSIRLAGTSGASLNEATYEECKKNLGISVRTYYAMTEVRPIFCFDINKSPDFKKESVGKLIAPTQVRIVRDDGQDALDGESGELWVKGPSYSGSYYNDPERTKESMDGDWFKTGDLVFRDSEGYYYIVGRLRDQIISGGAKIAPIEVENILLTHPGIEAAAVVGVPDPVFGQIVKAVVVKSDPAVTEDDIISFCKDNIAAYKVPRLVSFLDALPLAPSGKILKNQLI